GRAAAAGVLDVGVVELEPAALEGFQVVYFAAVQVHQAHRVHEDLEVGVFKGLVLGRAIVELHRVAEPAAAAAHHRHAQAAGSGGLGTHDFLDLLNRLGSEGNHMQSLPRGVYHEDMDTRIERDSLGEVPVPRAALWGAQTQRAIENYPISGLRAAPALIRAYGLLKAALAEANGEAGRLPKTKARGIARAAREVAEHRHDEQFPVDVFQAGAGVSFHMNVNEVIAHRASQLLGGRALDANDDVNRGQSTNDTFPTALRMALRFELDVLSPAVEACARAFASKGREFRRVAKAGRTHLQDAVPVTLGAEFAAYGATLRACGRELAHAADGLLELGLGGSAAGNGVNASPQVTRSAIAKLRRATGRQWRSAADLCAAMQSQLPLAAASAAMRNLALELIRI